MAIRSRRRATPMNRSDSQPSSDVLQDGLGASTLESATLESATLESAALGPAPGAVQADVGTPSAEPPPGEDDTPSSDWIHSVADTATSGSGSQLPHFDILQASFGEYDLSGAVAHTGSAADAANATLGSGAFAKGQDVVLSSGKTDLHTVAHEAAHVVQQQAGLAPAGGVGASGDVFERNADAVADAVVAGKSAEPYLDELAGKGSGGGGAVAVQGFGLFKSIKKALKGTFKAQDSKAGEGDASSEQRTYEQETQGKVVAHCMKDFKLPSGIGRMMGGKGYAPLEDGEHKPLPKDASPIRSLRIPKGKKVKLSASPDFKKGHQVEFKEDQPDLGPFGETATVAYVLNDDEASEKAFQAHYGIDRHQAYLQTLEEGRYEAFRNQVAGKAALFSQPKFKYWTDDGMGKPLQVLEHGPRKNAGMYGKVKSVLVPEGHTVHLWSQKDFQGDTATLTRDTPEFTALDRVESVRVDPPGKKQEDAKSNIKELGESQGKAADAMKALGQLSFTDLGSGFASALGGITDTAVEKPGERAKLTVDVAVPVLPPIEVRVQAPVTLSRTEDGKTVVGLEVTAGPQLNGGFVSATLQIGGYVEASGNDGTDAWKKILHTLIRSMNTLDREWSDYVGSPAFTKAVDLASKVEDKAKEYGQKALDALGLDGTADLVDQVVSRARSMSLSSLLYREGDVDDLLEGWDPGEYIEEALVVAGQADAGDSGVTSTQGKARAERRNAVRRTKQADGSVAKSKTTTDTLHLSVSLPGDSGLSLGGDYILTYERDDRDRFTLRDATIVLSANSRIPLSCYDELLDSSSGVLAGAVGLVADKVSGGPTGFSKAIGHALARSADKLSLDADVKTRDALRELDSETRAAGAENPSTAAPAQPAQPAQPAAAPAFGGFGAFTPPKMPGSPWSLQGDNGLQPQAARKPGVVQALSWDDFNPVKQGKRLYNMAKDAYEGLSDAAKKLARGDVQGATVGALKEMADKGLWGNVPNGALDVVPLDDLLSAVGVDKVLEKLPGNHYLRSVLGKTQSVSENGREFDIRRAAAGVGLTFKVQALPSTRELVAEMSIEQRGAVKLEDKSGKASAALEQMSPVVSSGRVKLSY